MNVTIDRMPRRPLGHWPTPLEDMRRLSKNFRGPRILIKRDDCTGLGTGGNKTRKLEYFVADALANNADTLVTLGANQSNHSRQTAAAAARYGLRCEVVAVNRVPIDTAEYRQSGNRLLTEIFGANVREFSLEEDPQATLDLVASSVRQNGGVPYVIPFGGSNAVGALGYVQAASELLSQFEQQKLQVDAIVHASGSGGTQSGLLAGLRANGSSIPVLGICVVEDASGLADTVLTLAQETATKIGADIRLTDKDVFVSGDYVGEAYGIPTAAAIDAIERVATQEGILLDPVYSGKAMAGLFDLVQAGKFDQSQTVVFLHTGGSAALFSYVDDIRRRADGGASSTTTTLESFIE